MPFAALASDPIASAAICGALALILFAAAWHKFSEPLMFEAALEAYQLLPKLLVAPLARVLPIAEVGLGIALLIPATRQFALPMFVLLVGVYAVAIAINLVRGRRQIDCGCGAEVHLLSWGLVARNLFLLLAAVAVCRPSVARSLEWLDGFTLLGGVLALYTSYLLFDELLRQHGRINYLRGETKVAP